MFRPSVLVRHRIVATVVVLSAVVSLALGSPAQATSATTKYTVMTAHNALLDNGLSLVSCARPGDCAATGLDNIASGATTFMGFETNGVWASFTQITFSPALEAAGPVAYPYAITCSAVGDCVIVGRYQTQSGAGAFTDTSTNGEWAPAQPVAFAAGVEGGSDLAQLNGVSCPTTGNCVAVGMFTGAVGSSAMSVQSVAGVWGTAVPTNFAPGSENATPSSSFASVDCPTPGNCTAAGEFVNAAGDDQAMTDSSTNGSWSNAVPMNLTGSVQSATPASFFTSVSCAKVGDCAAAGQFIAASGGLEPMVESSTNGTWSNAVPGTLTAYGSTSSNPVTVANEQRTTSVTVSCGGVGTCMVVGTFTGELYNQAFTWAQSAGTWAAASTVTTVAAGSSPTSDNGYTGVSCPTVNYCLAVGSFMGSQTTEPMTDAYTVSNGVGTWANAVPVSASFTNGSFASFYGVSCPSVGNCAAVGAVRASATNVSMIESLSTTYGPPSSPLHVSAKASAHSVAVSWKAPLSNGGSPITTYRVVASGGGAHCTTTATKCTLRGLRAKTTYVVRVTASNATTAGAASKPLKIKTT